MAFDNTAPLSYAFGQVVKYVDAKRGLSDEAGGPKLQIVGLYNPSNGDLYDPNEASSNASITRVAANTTSQQLLPANASRKGIIIVNEQSANVTVFIKYGSGANTTHYTLPLYAGGIYEAAIKWTGNIHVVTASGTSNVVASDLS